MKIEIAFIITALLSLSCNQQSKQTESNKFPGLWTVHIMEQLDTATGEWNEWRNGMQGYILYDNNNTMAVHLTTTGYEDTDLRFPNFVDSISVDALKHLTNSYVYFAKYTIDEEKSIVEHARISHSNPGSWDEVVHRKYTFKGDTLILEPLEKETSGLRLTWVKESASGKR